MSETDQEGLLKNKQRYQSKLKIYLIVWNITLSSFYFGYNIVYLSSIPTSTLRQIYSISDSLSNGQVEGILNGCIPIGALIGALCSSILISRLSRKNCLIATNIFAIVMGCLVYIPSFYLLLIVRICQGFCVGMFSAIAPLIVKQLSPNQISGTLGSFTQLNVTIGVFFGCFFKYILGILADDSEGKSIWIYEFGFPLITLIIQTLILIFVFPYETPKYLLINKRKQDAKQLIAIIYKEEYVEEVLLQKQKDLQTLQKSKSVIKVDTVLSENEENKRQNKITVIVALHLAVLQQLSGINAVAVYGGKIAGAAVPDLKDIMPSLINFQQVLATFVTGYLLSKFGRKTILQIGTLAIGIACLLIMLGFFLKADDGSPDIGSPADQAGKNLVLVGLFVFMAVFGLSLGPIVWLYIPEIVQPKIVPYSTTANWITASLVIILFPIITDNVLGGNPGVLFIFFTAWCIGSLFFNARYVVQTKDKTQAQIRQKYVALS